LLIRFTSQIYFDSYQSEGSKESKKHNDRIYYRGFRSHTFADEILVTVVESATSYDDSYKDEDKSSFSAQKITLP